MRRSSVLLVVGVCGWVLPAWGQTSPPPEPPPQSSPPIQPVGQPPAQAQPTPAEPAPAQPAPAPTYAEPPPPTYAEPPPPAGQGYSEPPLAEPSEPRGGGIPDFGVRVDPLNLLLFGRMGVEVEVELLEWLTAEAVPVFVTNEEPVLMPDDVKQASNGLGAMSGASVDLAAWLNGDSFNGTAIRAGYGHYAYSYESSLGDSVDYTEKRIAVLLASHRTWSWFTIAGAFGLSYETNDQQRCFADAAGTPVTSGCDDGEVLLRTSERDLSLNSSLYPYAFEFRFSLGVAIED